MESKYDHWVGKRIFNPGQLPDRIKQRIETGELYLEKAIDPQSGTNEGYWVRKKN